MTYSSVSRRRQPWAWRWASRSSCTPALFASNEHLVASIPGVGTDQATTAYRNRRELGTRTTPLTTALLWTTIHGATDTQPGKAVAFHVLKRTRSIGRTFVLQLCPRVTKAFLMLLNTLSQVFSGFCNSVKVGAQAPLASYSRSRSGAFDMGAGSLSSAG